MRNILGAFFGFIADLVNGAEKSFLDLLSALVPYAVPVIPAYLTYYHTIDQMGFPHWVALTAAFVVEVLGITAVSTAIRFWRHNIRYKDEKNKAPFWLAVGVYIFYIIVVLIVNVILEIVAKQRSGPVIWAIGFFSMLSVPSGVLISIRTQYSEMLEDIGNRYKKPNSVTSTLPPEPATYKEKHASDYRDRIVDMLNSEYSRSGQILAPKQITARLKLNHANNKGYVSSLTSSWKKEKGIE